MKYLRNLKPPLKNLSGMKIYDPILNSRKLYGETIKGNTDFINKTLDENHKELASMHNKKRGCS